MAIENAVAAALILDSAAQKKFDRICLYVGIGCFVCIHVVFLAFVIVKVRMNHFINCSSKELLFQSVTSSSNKYDFIVKIRITVLIYLIIKIHLCRICDQMLSGKIQKQNSIRQLAS